MASIMGSQSWLNLKISGSVFSMPKINFEIPVPVDTTTAFKKVKTYLSKANDITKFDSKTQCTFDDKNHSCSLKGGQFKAEINMSEGKKEDTSVIEVDIDIPLALVLFKGKIKEMVEKSIKKVFKS